MGKKEWNKMGCIVLKSALNVPISSHKSSAYTHIDDAMQNVSLVNPVLAGPGGWISNFFKLRQCYLIS